MQSQRQCRHILLLLTSTAVLLAGAPAVGQDFCERDNPSVGANRILPQPDYPANKWRLGVQVRNLETGVLITAVADGSPAAAAGLQVGDTVVNVAGYQVGYVNGRLYDIADELARRVDAQGRVTLLIFSRDSRLASLVVGFGGGQLPQVGARIDGTVTIDGSIKVDRNATMAVRLLDVTHPHWSNVVVAREAGPMLGRQSTGFRMLLGPDQVLPGHRYALDAQLYQPNGHYVSARQLVPDLVPGARLRYGLLVNGNLPLVDPTNWYRQHLNRAPTALELAAWREHLERGHTPEEIEAQILGSRESFDRHKGNNAEFVRGIMRSTGAP